MKTLKIITSIPFILTAIGIWWIKDYGWQVSAFIDVLMVFWLVIIWRKDSRL